MNLIAFLFLGWMISPVARAELPVIHTGEDSRLVLARAAAAAKVKPETLHAQTPLELTQGKPALLQGPGRARVCSGLPTTESAVGAALVRAERAMAYLELDKALAHLEVGEQALACLNEIAIPARAARVHFLRGVMAFDEGDPAQAKASFAAAVAFDPQLPWDTAFPPDGERMLTEAREAAADPMQIPVQLVPRPPDGSIWVDGTRVLAADGRFTLSPGPHLVQIVGIGLTTLRVQMRTPKAEASGESTLLVPQILPQNAAQWAWDEEQRAPLDQVLGALFDPHTEVLFTADGKVIRHVVGTEDWEALKVPKSFARVGGEAPRILAGRATLWTGVAVFSGGALLATSSWLQGLSAVREYADATNHSEGAIAQDRYSRAADRMVIARWVTLSGVVLAGSGAALTYLDAPLPFTVAPVLLPGGGGLQLQLAER